MGFGSSEKRGRVTRLVSASATAADFRENGESATATRLWHSGERRGRGRLNDAQAASRNRLLTRNAQDARKPQSLAPDIVARPRPTGGARGYPTCRCRKSKRRGRGWYARYIGLIISSSCNDRRLFSQSGSIRLSAIRL